MSEEGSAVLSTEKQVNGIIKENAAKPALQSGASPSRAKAEEVHIRESLKKIEPSESEEQNRPILGGQEQVDEEPKQQPTSHDTKSTESMLFEKKVDVSELAMETTSDGSTETKSLGKTVDVDEAAVKLITSDETKFLGKAVHVNEASVKPTTSEGSTETKSLGKAIDVNEASVKPTTSEGFAEIKSLGKTVDADEASVKSTSEKSAETKSLARVGDDNEPTVESTTSNEIVKSRLSSCLARVDKSIQLINEELKDMKISPQGMPPSASAKKGSKPLATPRARSTPVLTSPPLTRSRSRDLRKFPSTPSSPKRLINRKTSGSDSGETEARGRQRARKN